MFPNMTSLGFMLENGLLIPFLEYGKDVLALGVDKHTAHAVKQYIVVQHVFIETRKII